MFIRYLTSGWRNLTKNKLFSVINISGLSIGLAVTTLILFWVVDELNFDKFHENIDQIYTVFEHQQYSDGQELYTACTPFALSKMLATSFDEVEQATTFTDFGKMPFKYNDNRYSEGPVLVADENFLKLFSFKVVSGDYTQMCNPDKIAITTEMARLFFGNEDPLGKVITLKDKYPLEVCAVIENPGKNSSYSFKFILPLQFLGQNNWADINTWGGNWPQTSILLKKGMDPKLLGSKILNICKEHGQENTSLYLFPFKDEHLYSYSGENNQIQYIYQFLAIAFIIILIACINFVNFSTARTEQRKPEIGIRKSLGASRFNLIRLFFYEKGLTVTISLIVGFLLVLLLLPVFSEYTNKEIGWSIFKNRYLIVMLTGVIFTSLMMSILYPALYMSRFEPIKALKKNSPRKPLISFKNVLIVVQFALSIGLIICSLFISNQLRYVSHYNLGYNQENLIYLELDDQAKEKHTVLTQELAKVNGVINLSACNRLPIWGGSSSWGFNWDDKAGEKVILFHIASVDRNFMSTMGITLTDGATFSEKFDHLSNTDKSDEVVLNEEAIRLMGMENPVGKHFWGGDNVRMSIVGVVQDYNFLSLRNKIEPLLLYPLVENPSYIIMRIEGQNMVSTIESIKQTMLEVGHNDKCEIGFFDEQLGKLYQSETRIAGLFNAFTIIAIFISCIGLFGLSLYAIEIRRKEIGIRKVNGSTRLEIIALINQEFVTKVIVAFIIACPVAYLVMNKWLENFAYKTNLSWWVFVTSGLIALIVALITVSWQSWRAATRNPVEALRYE